MHADATLIDTVSINQPHITEPDFIYEGEGAAPCEHYDQFITYRLGMVSLLEEKQLEHREYLQTKKDAGPKSTSDPTWSAFSRRCPRVLRWSCSRRLGRGMQMPFCRTLTPEDSTSTTACTSNILLSLGPGHGSRTWASLVGTFLRRSLWWARVTLMSCILP